MKVVFSASAAADLRSIALYIARDDKSRAQSFARELRSKAKDIGDHPRAFPLLPGYEDRGIRRRAFRRYTIFYQIEPSAVVIIHVLHSARDHEALLDDDKPS